MNLFETGSDPLWQTALDWAGEQISPFDESADPEYLHQHVTTLGRCSFDVLPRTSTVGEEILP